MTNQERRSPRSPDEVTFVEGQLAQHFREEMDGFLGGERSRAFTFPNPTPMLRRGKTPLAESLFGGRDWPDPVPLSSPEVPIMLGRDRNVYTIIVGGVTWGVVFSLQGDYPRVSKKIVGASEFEETITMAEVGRLRPRSARLEYGLFMLNRIRAAARTQDQQAP